METHTISKIIPQLELHKLSTLNSISGNFEHHTSLWVCVTNSNPIHRILTLNLTLFARILKRSPTWSSQHQKNVFFSELNFLGKTKLGAPTVMVTIGHHLELSVLANKSLSINILREAPPDKIAAFLIIRNYSLIRLKKYTLRLINIMELCRKSNS